MLKKTVPVALLFTSSCLCASNAINLYQAPMESLKQFPIIQKQNKAISTKAVDKPSDNSLQEMNQTQEASQTIIRYQQLYKGVPVVGAQVMITKDGHQGLNSTGGQVNGYLLNDIHVDITPQINAQQAIELVKASYSSTNPELVTHDEIAELQIRPDQDNALKLVYLVSFKAVLNKSKPVWPFFVIDAHTGAVIKQWNNITTYSDSGPGGNEKVHEYWYGKDGLPYLDVTQRGDDCVMEDSKVKLVNLNSAWDWENEINTPFMYPCNANSEENINGAYSPRNDAYYFGHTIVDMYKDWYGLNALQLSNGQPMKLVMKVHFGEEFDNAFWDGASMSFGDGHDFYPLVSLDVAGHEVTHGFTQQHSGLEYHDQSGALNESLSDMAGQASRAYLLEKTPLLYGKMYLQPSEVTWGIGETIMKEAFGKALRFMDFPSSDGSSADCMDKALAQQSGSYCAISYPELIAFAKANIPNVQERQSFIVHTASGVFNKAFYLLSRNMGIKSAYHLMIIANTKYWTPTTDFKTGACGVIYAAKDLGQDVGVVKSVFAQVGVDTVGCAL